MKFMCYETDGTIGYPENNISDILAAVKPDDIIDALDEIGVRINRYFTLIDNSIDYVIWLNQITGKVTMDMYKDEDSQDAEFFRISDWEIQTLVEFFEQ